MKRRNSRGRRVKPPFAALALAAVGCTGDVAPPAAVPPPARSPAGGGPGAPGSRFRFADVAKEAGLDRVVWCGRPGKDHLLDSAGTGAAFLDYDRDGRLDLYIVNGWRLEGSAVAERGRNALYRGRSDGTFEDATEKAGAGGEGRWGSGAFAADFDSDGWQDLLVTCFGTNLLYRNRGDGTFEDVAPAVGLTSAGWHTGAAFLDAEGDGDLDLYVALYIDCTLEEVLEARPTLDWKGVDKVAFGPFGLKGAKDRFYLAEGGRFEEATARAGLDDVGQGFGFAVRAADFDSDGDQDLYVANDSDANYLYRNQGEGRFQEVGLWAGAALSATGAAQASMGIAAGDVTGDGIYEVLVTNFSEDSSTLYLGRPGGLFEDATASLGLAQATYQPLSWGTVFADLDTDGDLDLVIANGHIYPQVDRHPEKGHGFRQRSQVFDNREGAFVEVTDHAGPGFQERRSARGLAAGDYDDDGDVDLLMTALDERPALLRNEGQGGSWLTVACEVPRGSTLIGTRVEVTCGGMRLLRDIAAGDSYLSTHDPRLHFGLGAAERVENVEIRWPDGSRTVRRDVPARQVLVVRKG